MRVPAIVFFSVLSAALCSPAWAQGKMGFVNTERILRETPSAVRAQKKIDAEVARKEQELAKSAEQLKALQGDLERNGMTMTESQRRTKEREFESLNLEFQRKQREYREDINKLRNDELKKVVDEANAVIRQIAEKESYDVIFQDAVYASPRIDITEKVVEALKSRGSESKPAAR